MQKTNIKIISLTAAVAIMAAFIVTIIGAQSAHAAEAPVNLGAASPFAVLSGTPDITDAGNGSEITGNVGLSPATGAGIGLNCDQVVGVIYSVDATGPSPCRVTNGPLLVTVKNNLTTAYVDAAGRTPTTTVPTELGGTTLVSGVYTSNSTTFDISNIGPLVLDGQNDPSSVFIFKSSFEGTGLNVGPASEVQLANGAQACNVFWQVDTASINTTANFVGTILALNSISVANGATINGRLLARNGNVTLINDTITVPLCVGNDTPDNGEGEGVVPGLPNTGGANMQNTILVTAVSAFFVTIASLLAYAFYKKRSI